MPTVTKSVSSGRKSRPGSRRQPEQTRQAILDAAMQEFSSEGVAGARTEAIARAAGVNKALLYYYFRDKEALHGAVLDRVFSALREALEAELQRPLPPRERLLACVGAHFDHIAKSPLFPQVMMREMMRAGRHGSPHVTHIAEQYLAPVFAKLSGLIREGIASGEFRPVDPMQFVPSMVALVVFYFSASPVLRVLAHVEPLAPERIAIRRAAVLDFISAALFTKSVSAPAAAPVPLGLPVPAGEPAVSLRPKGARR